LLEKVIIKFEFNHEGNQGVCIAEIGFQSALNNKVVETSTELQIILDIKSPKKGTKYLIKNSALHKQLSKKLDEIVKAKIIKVKSMYA
jgi:hypothetical protein